MTLCQSVVIKHMFLSQTRPFGDRMLPVTMSSTPQLSEAALDAGFLLSPNVTKVVKFGVRLRHVKFQGKDALVPTESEIRHALCGFPLLVIIDEVDYRRKTVNKIDFLEKVE